MIRPFAPLFGSRFSFVSHDFTVVNFVAHGQSVQKADK